MLYIKFQKKKVSKEVSNPIKFPEMKENGNKKIALALSGLATIGLAAVAIKKGKAKDAIKVIKKEGDTIAKEVAEQVKNGATINQVKKIATKNQPKATKDIIKKAASEAKSEVLEQQAKMRQEMIKQSQFTKAAPSTIKALNQGAQKANAEVLQGKISTANQLADEAIDKAKKLADIATSNPTRKNKKYAQMAYNNATQAKLQAVKVEQNSTKLI